MTREKLKTDEYFKNFIAEDTQRIIKFQTSFTEGATQIDRIPSVQGKMFSISLGLTVAKYSSGDSIENIREQLKTTINFAEKAWKYESGYVEMVWLLSLTILLDLSYSDFFKLVALVDRENTHDYLIDYLIVSIVKEREISEKIRFEKPYQKIKEITKQPKEQAQERMKQYLKKDWYSGHSDSYWYNNHKSKHDTYFGYWSFESAAIVKIMNLNDTTFKNSNYYPFDLVHRTNN